VTVGVAKALLPIILRSRLEHCKTRQFDSNPSNFRISVEISPVKFSHFVLFSRVFNNIPALNTTKKFFSITVGPNGVRPVAGMDSLAKHAFFPRGRESSPSVTNRPVKAGDFPASMSAPPRKYSVYHLDTVVNRNIQAIEPRGYLAQRCGKRR